MLVQAEFSVRVRTNALGFREPRLPGPKPAATVRIVALGDSFTQGYGVEEDESFPSRLEEILQVHDPSHHYEVINLGVPGTCPLDYLRHLVDVGLAYDPDVVLVGLMGNDVNDVKTFRDTGQRFFPDVLKKAQADANEPPSWWKALPERLFPALYVYFWNRLHGIFTRHQDADASRGGGRPSEHPSTPGPTVPEDHWRDVLLDVASRYRRRAEIEAKLDRLDPQTIATLKPVLTGDYRFDATPDQEPIQRLMATVAPDQFVDMVLLPPSYDAAWKETTATLLQIDRLDRGAGARTIIVFIPHAYQVSSAPFPYLQHSGFSVDPRTLTDTTFIDRLEEFGWANGIEIVDLLTPLRARRNEPLYFPKDMHWTPQGHRLAAEVIADAILSR